MDEPQALAIIQGLLATGHLPADQAQAVQADPELREIIQQLDALYQFSLALANGNLEPELRSKGRLAGALKTLQANLRHLTWQTQRVAEGDLTQQVRFMGEFSDAFNTMVARLSEARQALEAHAQDLAEGRQAAEAANDRLQRQMDEIQALQVQLREQAIRDPLTGCFNRRFMEEVLSREFGRALRADYSLCLVMLDVDYFKRVNDTYGHLAGDAVLRAVSRLLREQSRAGDMVCRYGGEEFLVVLPIIAFEHAVERAEDWRAQIQQLDIAYEDMHLAVTVSLGVAACPQHGASPEQVVRQADLALYQAKNAGRNCVQAAA